MTAFDLISAMVSYCVARFILLLLHKQPDVHLAYIDTVAKGSVSF